MYKLDPLNSSGNQETVYNLVTCFHIPFDPANTDYQEFLRWKAEGNEPLPHDAPVLEQTSDNTFTVQL